MKYKISIEGAGMFYNRWSVNKEGEEFLKNKIENGEIEELCGDIWSIESIQSYFSVGSVLQDRGKLIVKDKHGEIIVEELLHKTNYFNYSPMKNSTSVDIWEAESSKFCEFEYELELEDEEFEFDRLFLQISALDETKLQEDFIVTDMFYLNKKTEKDSIREILLEEKFEGDLSKDTMNQMLELVDEIASEAACNVGEEEEEWHIIKAILDKIKLKIIEFDDIPCSEGSEIYSGIIINENGEISHIDICS